MPLLRRLALLVVLAVACLWCQQARGGDERMEVPAAVASVVEALEQKDEAEVRRLSRLDRPDAWRLASELCIRGHFDAARAVAAHAHPGDVKALPTHLDRVERDGVNQRALAAHQAFVKALDSETPAAALVHLEGYDGPYDCVISIYLLTKRAVVEEDTRGYRAASPLIDQVARAAEDLGWLASATLIRRQAVLSTHELGFTQEMTRHVTEALRIARLRGRPEVIREDELNLAGCLLAANRLDEAEPLLRRLRREFEEAGQANELARCAVNLAIVAARRGRLGDAIDMYREAHASLVELGDEREAARAIFNLGVALGRAGRPAEAANAFARAKEAFERFGEADHAAVAAGNLASQLRRLGDHGKALESGRSAVAAARAEGSVRALAEALMALGVTTHSVGDTDGARALFTEALELRVQQQAIPFVLGLLGNLSSLSRTDAELAVTTELHESSLVALRPHVTPLDTAHLLEALARHLGKARRPEDALANAKEAEALREEHGTPSDRARSHRLRGDLHFDRRALTEAAGAYGKALSELPEDETVAVAEIRLALGTTLLDLGRLDAARDHYEAALATAREMEDRRFQTVLLGNLSLLETRRGRLADALRLADAGLSLAAEAGDEEAVADLEAQLGSLRHRIGDHERALALHRSAQARFERLSMFHDALGAARNAAVVLSDMGNVGAARREAESVLEEARNRGYRRIELDALSSIATHDLESGAIDTARATLTEVLELATELSDHTGRAVALLNLGNLESRIGDLDAATSRYTESLEIWRSVGHAAGEADTRVRLARTTLRGDDPDAALVIAREGIERLPLVMHGLADEERAQAADQWYALYEIGYLAAVAREDSETMLTLAEGSRAAGLLLALRPTDGAEVAPALVEREVAARAALVAARARAEAALRSRSLKATREARGAIEVAEEELLAATAAIQRAARRSETVAVVEPATLREIQRALDRDQALVLHMGAGDQLHALVITRKSFRLVEVGTPEQVYETVLALLDGDPGIDVTEPIARLRSLLAEPLELGDDVQHVLVSPSAATAYLPLSLLHPDRRVSAVPSGTALVRLGAARTKPGKQILGLGDPQYEAPDEDGADSAGNCGGPALLSRLSRLPGTAVEAEAIGDRVLLGAEATESGLLAALAEQKRWRAIHLACHGLVDVERPLLSGLALTPGGGDDGLLTCVDLGRADFTADLVVLSACETARGRVFRAEGVMGLTSAFLSSGASSVVASLWKVDDRATQALMTRFYELWNPDRGKGLPAAEALRQAQEHVRSKPEWSHPAYWAAWVLWGRPD